MGSNPEKALDGLYDDLSELRRQHFAAVLRRDTIGDTWEAECASRDVRNLRHKITQVERKIEDLEAQLTY